MNERIRDLKDKLWSEEYWNNPNTDKLLPAQLNRFAELIVQECMNAVCDPSTTYLESMTDASAMYAARERIRKHFRS